LKRLIVGGVGAYTPSRLWKQKRWRKLIGSEKRPTKKTGRRNNLKRKRQEEEVAP
jgi:hypothetical protein